MYCGFITQMNTIAKWDRMIEMNKDCCKFLSFYKKGYNIFK